MLDDLTVIEEINQVSREVNFKDDDIAKLVTILSNMVRNTHMWGASAPQLGLKLRVMVVDYSKKNM